MSPDEYARYLEQTVKLRADAERDFAPKEARYEAAERALESAQANEDAAADHYDAVKAQGHDPALEQQAYEARAAAQRERLRAATELQQARGPYQRAKDWLRKMTNWEDFARRIQAEEMQTWQELERFRQADRAFAEWQKAHPESGPRTNEYDVEWTRWHRAKERYENALAARYRNNMGLPQRGNNDPTVPQECGGSSAPANPALDPTLEAPGPSSPPASRPANSPGDSAPPVSPLAKTLGDMPVQSPPAKPAGDAPPAPPSPLAKTIGGALGAIQSEKR
jgi:hypothetical protein